MRQICLIDKEKGYLVLKLFKKYFYYNERKWFKIINHLVEQIIKMKYELEYLLCKYFTTPPEKENMKKVINDNSLSNKNLIDHKRMIHLLVGCLHNEEAKRIIAENGTKRLEAQLRDWILDWDKIKMSQEIPVF
jgi:hypothetical protein